MLRLLIPSAFGLIMFAVWVFAVLDVISTDEMIMRGLPKLVWVFVVVFVPPVGAFVWFALGRPVGAGLTPGTSRRGPSRSWQGEPGRDKPRRSRPRGIEDRDDWQAGTHPSSPNEGVRGNDKDPDPDGNA